MKIYSSVNEKLKRRLLFRGMLIAGTGAMLAVLSGTLIPPDLLSHWGLILWSISLVLIAWGYLPYRYLEYISDNPNKIVIDDDEVLHYFTKKKERFCIPLERIQSVEHLEEKNRYGIVLNTHERSYFLSFFTERSFNTFKHAFQNQLLFL